ncbi:MAG: tetratricopeptide repeat protein [Verrucomicrobiota bacterium]|nr:tetratricopeptide repeat protein [Verrucomicrobiota bacterium]
MSIHTKRSAGASERKIRRWNFWPWLLVTLAVAGVIAFFLLRPRALAIDKSIAILPFQNLSDSPDNAYFAGGIQEDIMTNLAKISELRVISRTSVTQIADGHRSVGDLRKLLGVGAVLEGSVRRIGNRVRVNVQLINTANDQHIWAETYERSLTDVFAIQSELALQIASTLQTKLSPKERARLEEKPTEDSEAYLTYLRAQDILAGTTTRSDLDRAAELYRKAIQLDPSFALAMAKLSYLLGTIYQVEPSPTLADSIDATARQSLHLQPGLPEGHLALGYFYYRVERDNEKALAELELAKASLPNDSEIFLVLGSIKRRQADWAGSEAEFERATTLNPRSPFLWINLGGTYRALRKFPEAARAFEKSVEVGPGFFMAQYWQAFLPIEWKGDCKPMEDLLASPIAPDSIGRPVLQQFELYFLQRKFGEAVRVVAESRCERFFGFRNGVMLPRSFLIARGHQFLGHAEEAKRAYQEAAEIVEHSPKNASLEPWRAVLLGQIYAGLGRREEALREANRARALLSESVDAYDGPAIELEAARIDCAVGEKDEALRLLEHSLATNSGVTAPMLRLDPSWDPLRADPRFQKLAP